MYITTLASGPNFKAHQKPQTPLYLPKPTEAYYTVGALIIANAILGGLLIVIIVYWAPKPCSNY